MTRGVFLRQIMLAAVVLTVALLLCRVAVAQMPSITDEPITPIPQAVATDRQRVALGAALFVDPRLSGTGRRSCASCHDLRTNGSGTEPGDRMHGRLVGANIITVFNSSLKFRLGWMGRFRTLDDQAAGSIESPEMMGANPDRVVATLRADHVVLRSFLAAYGHEPDWPSLIDAISTFERTLVTPGSRFDRWLSGDRAALTSDELDGYQLFKSIGCVACHQGVEVGGNLFERRGAINPRGASDGVMFLVPSLRNVAVTPPYFHDGSALTLDAAVSRMAAIQLGRTLTGAEVKSITAFLGTLTGSYDGHAVTAPR